MVPLFDGLKNYQSPLEPFFFYGEYMDEKLRKLRDELLEIETKRQMILSKHLEATLIEELNKLNIKKSTVKKEIIAYKMKNNNIVRKRS